MVIVQKVTFFEVTSPQDHGIHIKVTFYNVDDLKAAKCTMFKLTNYTQNTNDGSDQDLNN